MKRKRVNVLEEKEQELSAELKRLKKEADKLLKKAKEALPYSAKQIEESKKLSGQIVEIYWLIQQYGQSNPPRKQKLSQQVNDLKAQQKKLQKKPSEDELNKTRIENCNKADALYSQAYEIAKALHTEEYSQVTSELVKTTLSILFNKLQAYTLGKQQENLIKAVDTHKLARAYLHARIMLLTERESKSYQDKLSKAYIEITNAFPRVRLPSQFETNMMALNTQFDPNYTVKCMQVLSDDILAFLEESPQKEKKTKSKTPTWEKSPLKTGYSDAKEMGKNRVFHEDQDEGQDVSRRLSLVEN